MRVSKTLMDFLEIKNQSVVKSFKKWKSEEKTPIGSTNYKTKGRAIANKQRKATSFIVNKLLTKFGQKGKKMDFQPQIFSKGPFFSLYIEKLLFLDFRSPQSKAPNRQNNSLRLEHLIFLNLLLSSLLALRIINISFHNFPLF